MLPTYQLVCSGLLYITLSLRGVSQNASTNLILEIKCQPHMNCMNPVIADRILLWLCHTLGLSPCSQKYLQKLQDTQESVINNNPRQLKVKINHIQ